MKATTNVYLTGDYLSPEQIVKMTGDEIVGHFGVNLSPMEMEEMGWTKIGTATVEISLIAADQLVNQKLASLKAQLQKDRADSEIRQNVLLDRISKLEAIGYDQ